MTITATQVDPAAVGAVSAEVAAGIIRQRDDYDGKIGLALYDFSGQVVTDLTAHDSALSGLQAGTSIPLQVGVTRAARGVVYSNVADLSAFTVASDDGLTYVASNRVLLTMQTTVAQNGIYVVGTVNTGTAPLTRATDMPAAAVMPNGLVVEISEGATYKGSSWKAMSTQAGGWTVGTHNPVFYPRTFKKTVTLAAGTYKIGFGSTANPDEPLFLLSTTDSMVNITRDTAGGTLTGTVMYACPVTTRVAGLPGVANVVINSVIEAGTLQNLDTSTLSVLITNW
jgi:hypothetical protein